MRVITTTRNKPIAIAFITAIAPEHEVPKAARNDSTEHTSLVDGSGLPSAGLLPPGH